MKTEARGTEEGSNKPDSNKKERNKTMKKLMLVAAVAASTVAFADCGDVPVTPASCIDQVYKFAFTGKTTTGTPAYTTSTVSVLCGDDEVINGGCIARIPANLKIAGYYVLCCADCATLATAADDFWAKAFWATAPYKADIADGLVTFDFVNVIGKKAADAEAAGKFTGTINFSDSVAWSFGDLYFAGLGKYAKKTISYSISGYFAGEPVASWYIKGNICVQSDIYDCATLALVCEQYPNTVAYGKWSVKYDASATKKFMKYENANGLPSIPNYASWVINN